MVMTGDDWGMVYGIGLPTLHDICHVDLVTIIDLVTIGPHPSSGTSCNENRSLVGFEFNWKLVRLIQCGAP